MENQQHLDQLFQKYLNNNCSPEEATEVLRLMRSAEHRAYFQYLIDNQLHLDNGTDGATADAIERVFSRLDLEGSAESKSRYVSKSYRFAAAAAALVLISLSIGLFHTRFQATDEIATVNQSMSQDVLPGGNRATLKLADGQTIALSSEQTGIVAGDEITYFDGTSVLSDDAKRTNPQPHERTRAPTHTLTTPKGGTYQIELPDGTQVWLNAASTLEYPARFDDDERVVFLEGEAYFDVKHEVMAATGANPDPRSTAKPFKVISEGHVVEVFGTQFNIAAYADESETRTTLVEGRVRVTDGRSPVTLLPGEQAKVGLRGIRVIQANVESAIDWKNGDFIFDDEDLNSIMRKVARWYDVDVVYQGAVRAETYGGQISRRKNLSEILRILTLSGGTRFKVENRSVLVEP